MHQTAAISWSGNGGEGVSIEPLLETALAKKPDDGRPAFDMFRDRLMFLFVMARAIPSPLGGVFWGMAGPVSTHLRPAYFTKGACCMALIWLQISL